MNNLLKQQYIRLIECNNEEISILANTSAFIMQNFDDISWAGFYLLKNDELILLDYKTDFANNENELIDKYNVQLEIYKRALEKSLRRSVDKVYIYSLYLQKSIEINFDSKA